MEFAEPNNDRMSVTVIHIVSATALIHRTARPSISAMWSLLGISPKCVRDGVLLTLDNVISMCASANVV